MSKGFRFHDETLTAINNAMTASRQVSMMQTALALWTGAPAVFF
jgi:hypothetical protein